MKRTEEPVSSIGAILECIAKMREIRNRHNDDAHARACAQLATLLADRGLDRMALDSHRAKMRRRSERGMLSYPKQNNQYRYRDRICFDVLGGRWSVAQCHWRVMAHLRERVNLIEPRSPR